MFRHIAVAIIDRLAAWMCCALNVLTSLFFSFLFLVVTSRFRLLAPYTDEILDVNTSKMVWGKCTSNTKCSLIQVCNEITSALQVTGNNEMVYSAHFNSIKNYKLKFWGKSSNGATIIKVKKNKIKIITGCRSTDLCTDLFNSLKILPLQTQYSVSLLLFVSNNNNKFSLNPDVYNTNNHTSYGLHQPLSILPLYQHSLLNWHKCVQQSPTKCKKFKW